MGNIESTNIIESNRTKERIEIIMADEFCEGKEIKGDSRSDSPDFPRKILSSQSLSSIISASSATQTDPDLFTHWPKRRFLFRWLEKFKNYHTLLSKSQQFLSSTMSINIKRYSPQMKSKAISLSTQTVNQMSDYSLYIDKISTDCRPSINSVQNQESTTFKDLRKDFQTPSIFNNTYTKNIEVKIPNEIESDVFRNDGGPLKKKPKLHNKIQSNKNLSLTLSRCNLISHYSNKFYKSEVSKLKERWDSEEMISTESLTSITLISKNDNLDVTYNRNGNKKHFYRTGSTYNKVKSLRLKGRKIVMGKKQPKNGNLSCKNTFFTPMSHLKYKCTNIQRPLSILSSTLQEMACTASKSEKIEVLQNGKIQILSYKFWIGANYKNWTAFHNPTDRRIESIGRLAKCKIQLTNLISRHSDGLLKQQVIVYAPNQSSLEKCCKLFDDKFPEFYATSGLTRILYFRKDSTLGNLIDNYKNVPPINIPLMSHRNCKDTRRKKTKKPEEDRQQSRFLSSELLSG